jgi:toxin ParE1/3/4
MSVIYSADAIADLDEIEYELYRIGPHVARLFQTRLARAVALYERLPLSAAEYEPPDPRFPGLRQFPIRRFRAYAVFYQPTDDGIRIVRVLHTSRDLTAIFNPTPDPPPTSS